MLLLLAAWSGCRTAVADADVARWEVGRAQICPLSRSDRGSGAVSMALEVRDAPPLPFRDDGVGSEWAHTADALSHVGEAGWEVVGTTPSPEKGCERYVLKRRRGEVP